MNDCLHCEINKVIVEYISNHPKVSQDEVAFALLITLLDHQKNLVMFLPPPGEVN
jgi:predicted transcriptional regulator